MDRPKFSIALPTKGRIHNFKQCIKTLNKMPSASKTELLIMDGNTDGTIEQFIFKNRWNFFQYDILYETNCLSPKERGIWPIMLNRLFENASGEYVGWWSDDMYCNCNGDAFAVSGKYLDAKPKTAGVIFFNDTTKYGLFRAELAKKVGWFRETAAPSLEIQHPRDIFISAIGKVATNIVPITHTKMQSNLLPCRLTNYGKLYILHNNDVKEYNIPFDLKEIQKRDTKDIKLSILIPSLIKRNNMLNKLLAGLKKQMQNYISKVEILIFIDGKQFKVGHKRNILLECAKGEYSAFIDDDDDIAQNYISLILGALQRDVDCLGFAGQITTDGRNPRQFFHSIEHQKIYSTKKRGKMTYYRPPNHLNPMKTSIAKRFKFPDINCQEDADWCMQLQKSGLLKNQTMLPGILYHYNFSEHNTETQR